MTPERFRLLEEMYDAASALAPGERTASSRSGAPAMTICAGNFWLRFGTKAAA
jgi:hypothetical protein